MKRSVLALFTLGALLMGSPSSIQAQSRDDPNWWYVPKDVAGTTKCVPGGVRTVIDMEVTEDPMQLDITRKHELVHQRQLKDRSLCQDKLTWPKLLVMETEAYCEADADMALKLGINGLLVYKTILGALHSQFFGNVATEVVTRAWFDRCGAKLGVKG